MMISRKNFSILKDRCHEAHNLELATRNMRLRALNLKGVIFEGDVKSANLKTKAGEITILDNHRSLVALLAKGEAKIKRMDGVEERIQINSGFLEMSPENMLTLLIEW